MKVNAYIPARYAASRFPAKLLQPLGDRSVIRRVYENTRDTGLFHEVILVTDNAEIAREIEAVGGKVFMSKKIHESGSDRIAEALELEEVDLVVNVQGDEPFISRQPLEKLVKAFDDPVVQVASLKRKISREMANDPNLVKVITDNQGNALYFSRFPIPFEREAGKDHPCFLHLGIYAYRKKALMAFTNWRLGKLEASEKLEQLRYLENGISIKMVETDYESISIDTPADLERARTYLKKMEES